MNLIKKAIGVFKLQLFRNMVKYDDTHLLY